MQRPTYGQPPPPISPPLHHPVPQHVSTVPQLRSPPPPVPLQSQAGYGNPFQAQGSASSGNPFGAYGNFMNDQTAQMGFQVGQTALKHGQEYMEQNVSPSSPRHLSNPTNLLPRSTATSTSPLSNTTSTSPTPMSSTSSSSSSSPGDTSPGRENKP